MPYRALACDYDGTLATHGVVNSDTLAALERWRAAGRKLLIVSGRELPELKTVFPEYGFFDYIVAENGGLLYVPATDEERLVSPAPPPEFVAELVAQGVGPISVGRSIVATWQPHEHTVFETIQRMGLELQVIFNKGAVMILPTGVNKATGLSAALRAMELSRHEVVGVGDAENDHAFLKYCHCGVAVDNALPSLKQRAEIVTRGDHGRGVQELIDRVLHNDLADLDRAITRHAIALDTGDPPRYWFPGQEHLVLTGKHDVAHKVAIEIAEKLGAAGYQYCRFLCHTPEPTAGQVAAHAEVNVGTGEQLPPAEDVLQNLQRPDQSVNVRLCAHGAADRRERLAEIWHKLHTFVAERGRPHVIFLPSQEELADLQFSVHDLVRGFASVVHLAENGVSPASLPGNAQMLAAGRWPSISTVTTTT